MADNLQQTRPGDAARINLSEDYEVRYWTRELGVTEDELREAVEMVGPMAADVKRRLEH